METFLQQAEAAKMPQDTAKGPLLYAAAPHVIAILRLERVILFSSWS